MAPPKVEKKRKRKQKARTEVSSSSESSSESEKSSSPRPQESKQTRPNNNASGPAVEDQSESGQTSPPARAVPYEMQKPKDPEQTFEEFYLKQATKEFAYDIDKLRSAPDFNERHVPILVQALKQGTACFAREERQRIGGKGK